MTATLKVLPTADAHVGIAHPLDGPLAVEGSIWTHDVFTERLIQAQVIRRFEEGVDDADAPAAADEAPVKAGKAKPQAAA